MSTLPSRLKLACNCGYRSISGDEAFLRLERSVAPAQQYADIVAVVVDDEDVPLPIMVQIALKNKDGVGADSICDRACEGSFPLPMRISKAEPSSEARSA